MSDLVVATALGRPEHYRSRFNILFACRLSCRHSKKMLNLKQKIQPACLFENGGAERDRTVDPLLAKQVLSQLSYSPTGFQYSNRHRQEWWAWVDSNYRPHPYQGCALTN